MTIRRSAAAAAALLLLGAAACSGAGDAPKDVAVRGRVVTQYEASPVAATVWIGGVQQATAADGSFTFDRVETPYDLVVVAPGQAVVYEGVTRRDPVVPFPVSQAVTSATVSGTFSGGTYPEASDLSTRVSFGSPDALWNQWSTMPKDGTFSDEFRWPGERQTVSGVLRALQWRRDATTGKPSEYLGFGTKAVTLDRTAPLAGVEVALAPVVQVGRLQGDFVAPPGWSFLLATYHLYWPDHGELSLGAPSGDTFDFHTPALDGARVVIEGIADEPNGGWITCKRANLSTTATLHVQFPPPPTHVAPAEAATNVDYATTFSWFDSLPGVKLLRLSGAGTSVTLYTTRSSARMPDLRPMGLALVRSTPYQWITSSVSDATVDAVLVSPLREPADGCASDSAARAFTTSNTF